MKYLDFAVAVGQRAPDGYPVTARGPGGDGRGMLVIPGEPSFRQLLAALEALALTEAEITALGERLFTALFAGEVRDAYIRSLTKLGHDQGLRIRLDIDAREAEVAALPWELLYDADRGAPLALLDTPIVRYLPQPASTPQLAAPLPLRVLLTAAQTDPPLEIGRELDAVREALDGMAGSVEVVVEPHLTAPRLQQLLRQGFHIWHFVGHGGFARDGVSGVLMFEDPSGGEAAVSAPQLNVLLNRSGVRVVVLDACATGQLATDPFRSVAPALIRAQVPAVVAMQFDVSVEAARAFSAEFYRVLTEGLPIDACVTEGRKAVMLVAGLGRPDWGIPVIYTRADDGVLFKITGGGSTPGGDQPDRPSRERTVAPPDPTTPAGRLLALASQPAANVDRRELRRAMRDALSLDDLEVLCADITARLRNAGQSLTVSVGIVGGGGLEITVLNLIQYMDRRGLLQVLLDALRERE